ncbi:microsomal signal peptidase 18 kDa subunit [Aspergillus luchuensis]|uniref:Signal peptidase complex catalytic subunit SEC11 n=1 Tax=Aspergillus kawachii TaxID=1069201 RepID=A0A146FKU9_ASPKA|nr:microsomal signal peptidase 18 kDa subunit [Aspergillus luchuensis]
MVVSSESMEPTSHRGDLIFLWNRQQRIRAGDIPVVWFDGRPLPMVHRAIQVIEPEVGDNNAVDDTALYPKGQQFVYLENVVGLVADMFLMLGG